MIFLWFAAEPLPLMCRISLGALVPIPTLLPFTKRTLFATNFLETFSLVKFPVEPTVTVPTTPVSKLPSPTNLAACTVEETFSESDIFALPMTTSASAGSLVPIPTKLFVESMNKVLLSKLAFPADGLMFTAPLSEILNILAPEESSMKKASCPEITPEMFIPCAIFKGEPPYSLPSIFTSPWKVAFLLYFVTLNSPPRIVPPTTCSVAFGIVLPIPTLPEPSILKASVLLVVTPMDNELSAALFMNMSGDDPMEEASRKGPGVIGPEASNWKLATPPITTCGLVPPRLNPLSVSALSAKVGAPTVPAAAKIWPLATSSVLL